MNVTVIDMTGAPATKGMNVVIKGDRITSLERAGKDHIPATALVIDASDKFLIPGLWDMHVHVGESESAFAMYLANGITGIRDMGGKPQRLFKWREEISAKKILGPRIVACGPVVDGIEPSHPDHAITVSTASEARQTVAHLKKSGANFVKVYDGVPRQAFFALAVAAKREGISFVGHVPDSVSMLEASEAGQKSIEHLGTVVAESSDIEDDLRNEDSTSSSAGDLAAIPARMAVRGQRMLDTYSDEKAAHLFSRFVENRTWQVPTLVVKRTHPFVDDLRTVDDPRMKYVPQTELETWLPHRHILFQYLTPEWMAYRKRLFLKEKEMVIAMHRAGVELLAGTDVGEPYLYHGFSLHDELAQLVVAGLTPLEALQTATRNPAKFLGESDSLGTVEKGKIANLVLLEANPLDDIGNTRRINAVVLNGRYFSKESLQMMLADVELTVGKEDEKAGSSTPAPVSK